MNSRLPLEGKITLLQCNKTSRSSKKIDIKANIIEPYAIGRRFLFSIRPYQNFPQFAKIIMRAGREGTSLFAIPGKPRAHVLNSLDSPHYRLKYDQDDGRKATIEEEHYDRFMTIDYDGAVIPNWDPFNPKQGIEWLLKKSKIADVSVVVQLTSSQQPKANTPARIRLYFLVDHPLSLADRKLWAKQLKEECPELQMDLSVYRSNQPLFTAAPEIVDGDDQLKRMFVIKGGRDCATLTIDRTIAVPPAKKRVNKKVTPRSTRSTVATPPTAQDYVYPDMDSPLSVIEDDPKLALHAMIMAAVQGFIGHDPFMPNSEIVAAITEHLFQCENIMRVRGKQARMKRSELEGEITRLCDWAKTDLNLPSYELPEGDTPISLEEAKELLPTAIMHAAENRECRFTVFECETGLGKTYEAAQYLNSTGRQAEFYVEDYRQANEMLDVLDNAQIIYGRTYQLNPDDPSDDSRFCRKYEVIEAATEAGLEAPGVNRLCGAEDSVKCPYFDECPYIQQFKSKARVIIRTHSIIQSPLNYLDEMLPDTELVFVDESFHSTLVETTEIRPSELDASLLQPIKDGILTGIDPLKAMKKAGISMGQIKAYHDDQSYSPDVRIDPTDTVEEIMTHFEDSTSPASKLRRFLTVLCNSQGRCNGIYFDDREGKIIVTQAKKPHRLKRKGINVVMLDATPCIEVLTEIMPPFEIIKLAVKANQRIIQVSDRSGSNTHFKKSLTEKKGRISDIGSMAWLLGLGCIGIKSIEPELQKHVGEDNTLHFGSVKGSNKMASMQGVMILGRQHPAIKDMENLARAFWPHIDLLIGESQKEKPAEGGEIWNHKSPFVQALLFNQREQAQIQALARMRGTRAEKQKLGIIYSSMALPLKPDKWMTSAELLGPRRFYEVFRFCDFIYEVMPLSAKWLHTTFPEHFGSIKSADRFCEEVKKWLAEGYEFCQLIEYKIPEKGYRKGTGVILSVA